MSANLGYRFARAYFFGLLIYAAVLLGGTLALTLFRVEFSNPDHVAFAVAVRILATLAGGFLIGTVLDRKELHVAFVFGLTTTLPAVVTAGPEAFLPSMVEIALWGGAGVVGALPRYGARHEWHKNESVRTVVGGALLIVGYPLMLGMAVGSFVYMAPLLSRHKSGGVLSLSQLLVLLVLGGIGALCAVTGHKLVRASGETVVARGKGKYVLYLRSFFDDAIQLKEEQKERLGLMENPAMGALFGGFRILSEVTKDSSFEAALVDLIANRVGPVVALSKPGESLPPIGGAARLSIAAENWQTRVRELIEDSKLVLATLGTGGGLSWEIQQVLELKPRKLLLALPPLDVPVLSERLKAIYPLLSGNGIEVPPLPAYPRFMCISGSSARFIVAEGESVTPYRQALESINEEDLASA
jgi:hypothetical protein